MALSRTVPISLFVLVSVLLLASCASRPPADPSRAIPAAVLVRGTATGSDETSLDARAVAAELAAALDAARVFASVTLDEGGAAAAGDAICEIRVAGTGFVPESSRATGQAWLSSVVWFLTVFPAWWMRDREYPDSDVTVQALFRPAGREGGTLLQQAVAMEDLRLGLIDRGATWQYFVSLILPPFWMDAPEPARAGLRKAALEKACLEIAEGIRRDWPSASLEGRPGCFLVLDGDGASIREEAGAADLRGWIVARSPLQAVRVLDGEGNALRGLDRKALDELRAPAGDALVDRLGSPGSLAPASICYRIDLAGLDPGGSGFLRVQAVPSRGEAAGFTVRLAR